MADDTPPGLRGPAEAARAGAAIEGLSAAGARWVARALHPGGPADPCAYPDGHPSPSVCQRNVRETTFTTTSAGQAWDLLIISTNGDSTAALVFSRPAAGGPRWEAHSGATPWLLGISVGRVIFNKPLVISGVADVTGNGGGTAWNAFTGAGNAQITSPVVASADGSERWRCTAASITAYSTSSAIANGGTVTAGTFDCTRSWTPEVALTQSIDWTGTAPAVPAVFPAVGYTGVVASPVYFEVPMETSDMLRLNPGCYVAPASQGAYVPTRLATTNPYVAPPDATELWIGPYTNGALPPVTGMFTTLPTVRLGTLVGTSLGSKMVDQVFVPPVLNTAVAGSFRLALNRFSVQHTATIITGGADPMAFNGLSSGVDGRMTTVILFTGLHPDASITVKTVTDYQSIVSPDSPLAELSRPGPGFDPVAMTAYEKIARQMPQAHPSSMNSFGSIVSSIVSVAQKAAPVIARVLSAILPPPEVAAEAPSVSVSAPAMAVDSGKRAMYELREDAREARGRAPRRAPSASSRASSAGSRRVKLVVPKRSSSKPKKRKSRSRK